MTLGDQVYRMRRAARLRQEELAQHVGISTTALRAIEHGRIASPRVFVMLALAEALSMSLDTLLHGVQRPLQRPYARRDVDGVA